jgi:phosphatidylethanolamine/phosphatidyl-N-methylethanolamine N-methyltransferase
MQPPPRRQEVFPAALSKSDIEDAYARWAPVYDFVFAAVMRPGRKAAAAAINRVGGRVLDVGVGTGLELPMFDRGIWLVGIDLSAPMLRRAQSRVAAAGLDHVIGLAVMDAMKLGFRDGVFDAAVAPYVLTVVPDPESVLDEIARVVRPGGEIVLVNHIGAERGPRAAIEAWLGKRSATLGWRPEFPWAVIDRWLARRPDITLLERRTLAPFGLFTLVRLRCAPASAQHAKAADRADPPNIAEQASKPAAWPHLSRAPSGPPWA